MPLFPETLIFAPQNTETDVSDVSNIFKWF